MLILDTDTTTILEIDAIRAPILQRKIDEYDPIVFLAITTVQERYKGRIAKCSNAQTLEDYENASWYLLLTHNFLKQFEVLRFESGAREQFKKLKALKLRIGTNDLRIASIALAHDATVVTLNLSDFRLVPGLKVVNLCPP